MRREIPILLLAGCSTIPVYVDTEYGPDQGHTEDIEQMWGVQAEPSPDRDCAVVLHPEPDTVQKGRQQGREIWCPPDNHVCAHELGHVAGLEHVDDNANVMHQYTSEDTDQTAAEQRKRVKRLAGTLKVCREAKGLR